MESWFGPRERILKFGPKTVCDEELLCILLRTGVRRGEEGGPAVLRLASEIQAHFRGLKGVFAASPEELQAISGLGDSKTALLLAVGEICQRLIAPPAENRAQILSPEDAYRVFSDLSGESQEVVCAAFLDSQNRVLRRKEIFRGTVDTSVAQPREILREALRSNASRLVLAHNHPSDISEPSEEDRAFTSRVQQACVFVGISLLDHVIICGGGRFYSFAGSGELSAPSKKPRL